MYLFNNEQVAGFFDNLGFPKWLIYPLAVTKILGIIAILTKKSNVLKEWAYAGFFFDAVLAVSAHAIAGDGQGGMAVIVIIAVLVSRVFDKK